jgi:hypothetical protein
MRVGRGELQVNVRTGVGTALALLREHRALVRAAKRMPKPVPWDWARPRLVPLLAGPMIDPEGEHPVRSVMEPGVAVTFGIDLGEAFLLVDEPVARRWECTTEQIRDAALANLERWAARLEPRIVQTATMSGHQIRLIQRRPGWASSLLLVPDQLKRLFGSHDQVFGAPCRDTLLSFPTSIPSRLAADIEVDFEQGAMYPLFLDPFGLEDGIVHWSGAGEYDSDDLLDNLD